MHRIRRVGNELKHAQARSLAYWRPLPLDALGHRKPLIGKNGARERHPGARESPCLEKVERGIGTLGRGKAIAWEKWSAGKAPWGAGKPLLGKNGARERHPVWDFKSINRYGVGRAVRCQCLLAL